MIAPVTLAVTGPLSLNAEIITTADGTVQVEGQLGVALSQSVDRALGFLPWLLRNQLKAGLIQRRLEGSRVHFRIPNLFTLSTDVSPAGVLVLEKTYHLALARPIGFSETERLFRSFARGLAASGLHPFDETPIEEFLRVLKRRDRAELPFLSLFEGRGFRFPDRQTPPVSDLSLSALQVAQDNAGDLCISFAAVGRLAAD